MTKDLMTFTNFMEAVEFAKRNLPHYPNFRVGRIDENYWGIVAIPGYFLQSAWLTRHMTLTSR